MLRRDTSVVFWQRTDANTLTPFVECRREIIAFRAVSQALMNFFGQDVGRIVVSYVAFVGSFRGTIDRHSVRIEYTDREW